jgi:protein-tyrosine phosphatase
MSSTPITDSYWLVPGRLLAGEYPGAITDKETRRRLRSILDAGVSFFLDLTEEDEGLEPYEPLLLEETVARGRTATYHRLAIPDLDTPTTERMSEIQRIIAGALDAGHIIYVHCCGGIGRTGLVAGCYLVEQEVSGAEALAEIRRRRRGTANGWMNSPETRAQEDFIKCWRSLVAQRQSQRKVKDYAVAALV